MFSIIPQTDWSTSNPSHPERLFHVMVQAILTIGLVLMVSLVMVRSLDLKKVYPESPPTATSSHGLSGGAAEDVLTGNPRDMVAPSPRLPGRRSRARKKGRKRKKEGARSTWEVSVSTKSVGPPISLHSPSCSVDQSAFKDLEHVEMNLN